MTLPESRRWALLLAFHDVDMPEGFRRHYLDTGIMDPARWPRAAEIPAAERDALGAST